MSSTQSKPKLASVLFLTLMVLTTRSTAQPSQNGRPSGPPTVAIEACANAEQGNSCSFSGRRGETIQGTCRTGPNGEEQLACAPEQGRMKPQEQSESDR